MKKLLLAAALLAASTPSSAEEVKWAAQALQNDGTMESYGPRDVQWGSSKEGAQLNALRVCYSRCEPDSVILGIVGEDIMFGWVMCENDSIMSRTEKDENEGRLDLLAFGERIMQEEGKSHSHCILKAVYSVRTGAKLATWK